MIVRLIYKLVVAVSLLLGLALLILWSRTRHSDLLISGASGGTYRELRLGNSQLALTFVTTWPQGQHVRFGRPVAAKPEVTPPVLNGSPAMVNTPTATLTVTGGTLTLTNTTASATQTLALFDGAHITLQPSAAGWWPPTKSTGSAMLSDTPRTNMTGTAGMIAITGNRFSSATSSSGTTTTAPAALTIVAASASPTTSPASGGTGGGGAGGGGTLAYSTSSSGKLSFSGATSIVTLNTGQPATAPTIAGSTVSWTTLTIFTAHAYERYALPVWAVAVIVMLPVWWAIVTAALRGRRRRSRRRQGLCERCGYDLRGNPSGGTCPECGTATSGIPAPPTGDQLLARLR